MSIGLAGCNLGSVQTNTDGKKRTAYLSGMESTDPTWTTRQAGTLILTVWPETPLGQHQRYGYRISEIRSGQVIEGRDLFTGAGKPVEPDRAIRDLAGFLGAAGEARQYVLDNPGSSPENLGLFPAWVAEAARRNSDALTLLVELDDSRKPDEVTPRWINVVFLQGAEADDMLDLIARQGADAATEYLAGWDYGGEETVQAALENGYVYEDLPSGAIGDEVAASGTYTLTYNRHLGHVSLFREYHVPPDPALLDLDTPSAHSPRRPYVSERRLASEHTATRRQPLDAGGPDCSGDRRPSEPGRGLSL